MSDLTMDQQTEIVKTNKVIENGVVISNIIEMTVNIVSKVAGKNIADSVNGNTLNRNVLSNLVATRIKNKVMGV